MVDEPHQRFLSRLLLTYSDLCDSDHEIALCLAFMRITPPVNETKWTSSLVKRLIPSAYSTLGSASPYAIQPTQAAAAYCTAVYNQVKQHKENDNETISLP